MGCGIPIAGAAVGDGQIYSKSEPTNGDGGGTGITSNPDQKHANLSSVVVSTIAGGGGNPTSTDGVGTAATVLSPTAICYSEAGHSLLVVDTLDHKVRCVFPTSDRREAQLSRALACALFETGVLAIQPLIAVVFDFATADSTYILADLLCPQN